MACAKTRVRRCVPKGLVVRKIKRKKTARRKTVRRKTVRRKTARGKTVRRKTARGKTARKKTARKKTARKKTARKKTARKKRSVARRKPAASPPKKKVKVVKKPAKAGGTKEKGFGSPSRSATRTRFEGRLKIKLRNVLARYGLDSRDYVARFGQFSSPGGYRVGVTLTNMSRSRALYDKLYKGVQAFAAAYTFMDPRAREHYKEWMISARLGRAWKEALQQEQANRKYKNRNWKTVGVKDEIPLLNRLDNELVGRGIHDVRKIPGGFLVQDDRSLYDLSVSAAEKVVSALRANPRWRKRRALSFLSEVAR